MQFIHHNRGQRQPFLKRPPFNYRNDRFMFNINMHWIYRAEILSALCHKPVINRATLLAIKVDDLVDEKKQKKKKKLQILSKSESLLKKVSSFDKRKT